MRFNLRIEIDGELLGDLHKYFNIDREIVRRDLQEALTRTMLIYERDAARIKRGKRKPQPRRRRQSDAR